MKIREYEQKYGYQSQPSKPKNELHKPKQPDIIYQCDKFKLNLYEDWQDKTVYTLTGPVTEGIQHNIVITHEKNIEMDSVAEYAEWQIGIPRIIGK